MRGRKILPLLYLSIATGLIAIWALANSPARQIFFPNYSAIRDVAFMVVAFIPAPFLFYLNCLQKGRYVRLLHSTAIVVRRLYARDHRQRPRLPVPRIKTDQKAAPCTDARAGGSFFTISMERNTDS